MRLECKAEAPHRPALRAGIAKPHVLELKAGLQRSGYRPGTGLGSHIGSNFKEGEQVAEVEALLINRGEGQQYALDQASALAKRAGQKGQCADRERTQHRTIDDDGVSAVV